MQLGILTWTSLLTGSNSTFLGSDLDAHLGESVTDRTAMGPANKQTLCTYSLPAVPRATASIIAH